MLEPGDKLVRRGKLVLGFGLVLVVAACGEDEEVASERVAATATVPAQRKEPADTILIVRLNERNGSGQSGKSTLVERRDQTLVANAVTAGPRENDPQPSHIHRGSCNELGEIVHPLSGIKFGRGGTALNDTLDSLMSGDLVIDVHQSTAEIDVIAACGEIPAEFE